MTGNWFQIFAIFLRLAPFLHRSDIAFDIPSPASMTAGLPSAAMKAEGDNKEGIAFSCSKFYVIGRVELIIVINYHTGYALHLVDEVQCGLYAHNGYRGGHGIC